MRRVRLLAAAAALGLTLALSACGGNPTPPTYVTFTFDDNWADQKAALDVLIDFEMNATIYTNSVTVGTSNHLTRGQLAAYNSRGFEIGGHTLDHKELPKLNKDDARHQICDDRAVLANMGFKVTSFAYPFGALNPEVKQIVKSCGYNSARSLPGLRSPGYGCVEDCPPAESVPPLDPYEVRTPTTIRNDTTLAILKEDVTQAEKGGGWVPLVFHHICDRCADNSIDIETFTDFVRWLDRRPSSTVVKTVDQVVGGDFQGPKGLSSQMPQLPPPSAPPVPANAPLIRPSTQNSSVAFTIFGIDVGQSQIIFVGSCIALTVMITWRIATRQVRRAARA